MPRADRSDSPITSQPAIVNGIETFKTVIDEAGIFFLILILGFILLHCMGTSNTKISDTKQNAYQPETRTKIPHAWPESIDVDREGNIYFTDAFEGKLFRIARNETGILKDAEELLIEGLKRASGISINQDEDVLYMGLALKSDKGTEYKIARVPLDVFTDCDRRPYAYEALKVCARIQQNEIVESNLPKAPNGVFFHPDSQSVYYTHEALGLFGWLFKKKGHIGRVRFDNQGEPTIIKPIFSPNGIDVEPDRDSLALIVAITLENSINRIILTGGKVTAIYSSSLKKAKSGLLGNLPDGLIRLEDGDLLVAAFGSGKVFYLSKQGSYYSDPIEIVRGLGNPTDLTIGPSAKEDGMSLYVTTKKGGILPWSSLSKGRVVEITDIKKKIETAGVELSRQRNKLNLE